MRNRMCSRQNILEVIIALIFCTILVVVVRMRSFLLISKYFMLSKEMTRMLAIMVLGSFFVLNAVRCPIFIVDSRVTLS